MHIVKTKKIKVFVTMTFLFKKSTKGFPTLPLFPTFNSSKHQNSSS